MKALKSIPKPHRGAAKPVSVRGGARVAVSAARVTHSAGSNEVGAVADVVVIKYLHLQSAGRSRQLLARVQSGLPCEVVDTLVAKLGVAQKEIAGVLNIPVTTLSRRKKSGYLLPDESDRVVRLARVGALAQALMAGDVMAARQWMSSPLPILGDETPLRHCSTEVGAREVEQLIGRLRHGVFS